MTLTIRFARSSSVHFDLVRTLAAAHPSYTETAIGKQKLYEVALGYGDIELMDDLIRLAGDWKSTRLTLNGHRVSHYTVGMALFCCNARPECKYDRGFCKACPRWAEKMEELERAVSE